MTPAERESWRADDSTFDYGTPTAASSPAEPAAPVTPTGVSDPPASEPGTPTPKKNAESRIQELLQERAALRAELEAAKRPAPPQTSDAQPAASSPAPVETDFPEYDAWMAAQPEGKDGYGRYQVELARHVYKQEQHAARELEARTTAERERTERLTTYHQQAERFVTERPDYWQVIAPVTTATIAPPTLAAIDDALGRAGYSPQLLYHLGQHLDEFYQLITLPPAQAAYELGQLSAKLLGPVPSAVPTTAPPKLITSASPPPKLVNQRPAEAADPVLAAVNGGDYRAFKAAEEAQERATRR
jgi:hypothetical protein